MANWHKIWNGNLVNLDNLSEIVINEHQGGGRCDIVGIGSGTHAVLAKAPNREAAQAAVDKFYAEHTFKTNSDGELA